VTTSATPSARLAELGLALPDVVPPLAAYVPATRAGDLVFTAGQIPMRDGALMSTGKVGAEVSESDAVECAKQCALNGMAAAASVAGGLDAIQQVVKVVVYVASTPDFVGQPKIANGASELLGAVFGDAGQHARSAVGAASLPLDAPVEVELVVRVA
jgi:enamine deaminase RidA (YjgF/YER057c/UK114 family)